MNILTGLNAGPLKPSPQTRVLSRRENLEDEIDLQREENNEDFWSNGDITYDEFATREKFLDRQDPRVAESRARGWRSAAFAVAGGIAGAFTGVQGGATAFYGLGLATAGAGARGIYQTDPESGVINALGSGGFFGAIVGGLGTFGGTFGAIVGGITGAAVGANLPGLFEAPRH